MHDSLSGPGGAGTLPGSTSPGSGAHAGASHHFCNGHYPVSDKKMAAKTSRFALFPATTAKILSLHKYAERNMVRCCKIKIMNESVLQQIFPTTLY
ncbi:hypothetical protein RBA41_22705 [Massilia sp. CCM 9210]|uniref:hypothetical protein n=1 Tax=Massilia scottii TaxID=3057166 RepID=UPI0027967DA6|nr:hypothetical protein [Massilia sp. CCM 9210]MDQ1816112.1 hypothetical protein [Massilia sp. CCM 9210]